MQGWRCGTRATTTSSWQTRKATRPATLTAFPTTSPIRLALAQVFSQREYPLPLNTLSGLLQHEVIILKSCFDPTSRIESDAELEEYKAAYTAIHQRMRQHPEKLFILLTQPPLNPAETDREQARRARLLADWLASDEFKGDLPNLVVFDLFDRLAVTDGSSPDANMLRPEYRNGGDSHPNTACQPGNWPSDSRFHPAFG